MPDYGQVTRIHSAYPEISSITAITSGIVCQFITDTEAEVNARIAKRYSVPVPGTPPLLVAITERETRYRILVQRGLIQFPAAQQGQHPLQVQHKDDQSLLDKIAEGEISLVASGGGLVDPNTSNLEIWSSTKDYNPTFHEGSWGDQVQDTNKLDDIETDRQNSGL